MTFSIPCISSGRLMKVHVCQIHGDSSFCACSLQNTSASSTQYHILNNYSLKNNSSLVDLHCATVPSSFVTLGTHFLLATGL